MDLIESQSQQSQASSDSDDLAAILEAELDGVSSAEEASESKYTDLETIR